MLAGRTGLLPVMVGRSTELAQMNSLVAVAPTDTPTVALVSGEAGIGKTRLIQELISRLPTQTAVLAGQADPGAANRPFDLVLDALKTTLPRTPGTDGHGIDRRPQVSPGSGHSNVRTTPGLLLTDSQAQLLATIQREESPNDDRIQASVNLIHQTIGERAGLVVFEDIHWADPESLQVMQRLTEPAPTSLAIVGTFRPDGLSRRHPASAMIPRLERRHRVSRLHLGRLSPADVGAFLNQIYQSVPPFRTVQSVHNRTGGNPFFLEELVAASGATECADLDTLPLPWTVAELVQNQVDELSPEVRQLVENAAVLGRRISFDVLAAVCQVSEDDLIGLLHIAIERGVLVETEADYFSFRHELAREAVEQGLLGRKRRRLHERALEALRRADSADHPALAHHAHGAGEIDQMIHHAKVGSRVAIDRGATYQALRLAELGLSEDDDDLELLATVTEAAWLTGLLEEARGYTDRWLSLARTLHDPAAEAQALQRRVRVAFEQGDVPTMAQLTDELIGTIGQLAPADQAHAMAAVAQSFMLRAQVAPACDWADKATQLAQTHQLDDVRLAAQVEKGSALMLSSGRRPEGWPILEAAAVEADRTGQHMLASRALNNLMNHPSIWHVSGDVHSVAERIRHHARLAGWLGGCHFDLLAFQAAAEGDLDAALAHLEADPQLNGPESWARARATTSFRASLAIEAGDLDEAVQLDEHVRTLVADEAILALELQFKLAGWLGDPGRARALLHRLIAAVDHEDFLGPSHAHDLVCAGLVGGLNSDELQPLVDRVGENAGHRLGPEHPWRQLLDAQLLEAKGELADAATKYIAAARALQPAMPGNDPDLPTAPLKVLAGNIGTAHVGAARSLMLRGRLEEARHQAKAAAGYLAKWRGWRVDELEAVQTRLGLGPASSGPDALTPRERQVAELLTEGLTNAQLAERLFISPRTAAVHVSNILTKLAMSSRTEVATWVAANGVTAAN